MKTIWKFPIEIAEAQTLRMPIGAEVVRVGLDPAGTPCLWARVNPANSKIEHSLYLIGTGNPEPDGDNCYVGSFNQRPFVWHVFMPC